ncbi:hypothetical protein [bacterium endosymbiont of Bathymodiolus sp. 5 South]|jgi:hypothetical protein|uniref:hypothetical protein n=1 Tax=bacterium endosymbiont of Bathymodiolus sp. 5 South TaxID=1181670 RepID=UPI001118398B|nr:hypothetical protein [bacterium endosymbiont of Bathymodiolus sp. 5 South]VVH55663.1 hypothetical protein BSPCLSOX_904 [uncultured Gammaproteobacteria bacterium]VVH61541.1 hypothetical protein BSPWISOX_2153 [uncultured Gammaproteobacteria bacterium]VVM23748.1 hypothetical protein BSPWISOXPB_8319 [uncultured Gammaproteobacteria bacterium]
MNDKTIRYIGIGIGFLITLAILYVNNDGSFSEYGFFASDIKHTMIYDLLKDIVRKFGARYSTRGSWAYFLWFSCLAGGVWFSWEMRFKIARIITKVFKSIDEKV